MRDFRDLICSVLAFNAKRGTVDFGRDRVESDAGYVPFVAQRAQELLDAAKSRRDRVELVRYEDVAMDPAGTLQRLLRYLGVDDDPAIIQTMVQGAFDDPAAAEHRTSSSLAASIGRWQRELSPKLLAACRESLDPILVELGYEPTRGAPAQPTPETRPLETPGPATAARIGNMRGA